MNILLVHQEESIRKNLLELLEMDGHTVSIAVSSSDAVLRYTRQRPDLVLMNVSLGEVDGYRCTQNINGLEGERFAPVILMTTVGDRMTLESFLDCGAIDFIDMPCSQFTLRAKISGYERIRSLYTHLDQLQARSNQEIVLAKHMFDSMVSQSPKNIQHLKQWCMSAGHFCGDLLIYEQTPDGDLQVLMADFTGHGLTAAIGALPTSDAFFAMSRKGLGIAEIAREINQKLHKLLPVGQFCAASLIRFNPRRELLEVWLGGQPPLWLIGNNKQILREVTPFHLPLGMVSDHKFSSETLTFSLADVSHLLLFSDGLIEARNVHGATFGERGVVEALQLASTSSGGHLLQQIRASLVSFLDGLEPNDDVSLMTLDLGIQPQ